MLKKLIQNYKTNLFMKQIHFVEGLPISKGSGGTLQIGITEIKDIYLPDVI